MYTFGPLGTGEMTANEGIWWSALKMVKGQKHMMYEAERLEFSMDMSLKKDLIPRFLLLKREIQRGWRQIFLKNVVQGQETTITEKFLSKIRIKFLTTGVVKHRLQSLQSERL